MHGLLTGQFTPVSNFFCQENLTKRVFLVDNGIVLTLLKMAKFGSMAAGALALSTAIGAADSADAQASEIMIRLETGEQIVMEVSHVQRETQEAVMDHLRDCIAAGEQIQDVCVAGAVALMAKEQLEGVVRETRIDLGPLSDEMQIPLADLFREPVYCDFASTDAGFDACQNGTEAVTLASLNLQIAEVRARRIAAEARAQAEAEIGQQLDQEQDTLAAERDAALSSAEEAKIRADAAEAVLAVLRQIAAEEAAAQSSGPSLTN